MDQVKATTATAIDLVLEGEEERNAFSLVMRALEYGQLDRADLGDLARELTARRAPGYQELMFEPRGEDRIRVSFLDENVECLAVPLIDAIERVAKAARS